MSLTVSRRSNVNNFHSATKQQIIVNYIIRIRTVLKWMVICTISFRLVFRHQNNTSTEMENQACQSWLSQLFVLSHLDSAIYNSTVQNKDAIISTW